MAEDNAVRGRPFEQGNPGRPKGSRNKASVALEALEGQSAAIIAKVVEMALAGNPVALKLAVDRILSPRNRPTVSIDLPPIHSAGDGAKALAGIVTAVAAGGLTPGEGAELAQIVASAIRAFEVSEFEDRLLKVEEKFDGPASAKE